MFLFNGRESQPRSIAKAITWRMLGSVDTFMLSWLFTSNAGAAGAIASTEVFTKILLYYFHERAWASSSWGHKPAVVEDGTAEPEPAATLQDRSARAVG